jgi:hypothetical protein
MKFRTAVSCTLPVLLAACASPGYDYARNRATAPELRELQLCQRVFREQNTVPQVFDFEGHGRVSVREISLDGYPGNTYLRCRFDYENRTDEPIVQSWVMLDVLDGTGRLVASQAVVCIIPIPIPIERGSMISDELRTKTHGAHLDPGWSWRIRCVAERQRYDPLDPPAAEGTWPRLPPLIIKNRGQNDLWAGSGIYDRDAQGNRIVGGHGVRWRL